MNRLSSFPVSALIAALLVAVSTPVVADSFTDTVAFFQKSEDLKPFFDTAYGYAVFPNVGKGAVGIGGAFGHGKVYQAGRVTGVTTLAKISIGLQLGGQVFREIIFFQDQRSYQEFISGSFELDATASAVAITVGAQAQAGTGGTSVGASTGPDTGIQSSPGYTKGMAIFVHSKGGFMAEAAIGGQRFTFEPIK